MRSRTITTGALLSVFMLAACAGDTGIDMDLEVPDTIEIPDTVAVPDVGQVEAEMRRMGDEIDASAVQADLESAWQRVEAELRGAVESIRSGVAVDTAAIQEQMDEFQQTLDTSEVEAQLRDAWTQLRAEFDRLVAATG
jgi:hypothetical protein